MAFLKKFWPYSFTVEKKNVVSLVVNIIIQLIAAVVAGLLVWVAGMITGWIPVLGWIILGRLFDPIPLITRNNLLLRLIDLCDLITNGSSRTVTKCC